MQRARLSGVELEYERAGSGEPVIFIHGVFIADTFRPLLNEPDLRGRYRMILYRRRGYAGSSRSSGSVSIARQAADCRELLDHLGEERAHVVGHSFGGAVALQLALDAPGKVHSLALLEPALMAGASGQGYRESLERGVARYRAAGAEDVVDEFLEARTPAYRPMLDRVLPGAYEQAVADAATTFDGDLPGLLDWDFGELETRRISQPALSMLGGESQALWSRFGEVHDLLLDWLPRAEAVVLPGTTHFMQIQNPQGTAGALKDFWSRHPMAPHSKSLA